MAASRRPADQFGDLDVVEDPSVDFGSFLDTEHLSTRLDGGQELGKDYGGCSFSKSDREEETEKILTKFSMISTCPLQYMVTQTEAMTY